MLVAVSVIILGICFLLHVAVNGQKRFTVKTVSHVNTYNLRASDILLYNASDRHKNITDFIYDTKASQSLGDTAGDRNNDQFLAELNDRRAQNKARKGVILVTLYAEQQVGAAMNMFSLQKWAKTVNAFVVEPFVVNSEFRLPRVTSQEALSKELRFSDYFNIETWNELSIQNNGTPLISWEYFLDHKPTKYIFVNIINDLRKDVKKPVHVDDKIIDEILCKDAFVWFRKKQSFYIDILVQAKLVRRVCLSFYKTRMNISDFTEHIYGPHDPSEVIVWIIIWKGFAYYNRVRVVQQYFHRSRETISMVHTSNRIITHAQNYVRQYLGTEFGDYVSVSIRTVVRAKYLPDDVQKYTFFKNCLKSLGQTIQSLNMSNKKIFMSLDLGKFGDKTQTLFISPPIITYIEDMLFQTVYNGTIKMQEWESSFTESTDGITDTGYIATLQKTILDNSKCLIMFGGRSNFQRSIELEFKEKHGNNSCVYDVCYIK